MRERRNSSSRSPPCMVSPGVERHSESTHSQAFYGLAFVLQVHKDLPCVGHQEEGIGQTSKGLAG